MIQIERNDYVQPTRIREEVVQGICDAFLDNNVYSTFHPFSDGRGRRRTLILCRHKVDGKYYGFTDELFDSQEGIKFNGAEMKQAFEELIKAGYYMFRVYKYGSWMGYVCSKKPYYQGGTPVTSFDDFID